MDNSEGGSNQELRNALDDLETAADNVEKEALSFHADMIRESVETIREEAGEAFAQADSRTDTKKAKQLKKLAREYEDKAEKRRNQWDEKYDER